MVAGDAIWSESKRKAKETIKQKRTILISFPFELLFNAGIRTFLLYSNSFKCINFWRQVIKWILEAFSCTEIVCLTSFKKFGGGGGWSIRTGACWYRSEKKKYKTEINQSSQSGHYNHLLIQCIRPSFWKQRTFQSLLNTRKRMAFELGIDRFLIIAEHFFPFSFPVLQKFSAHFIPSQIFYLLLIFSFLYYPFFIQSIHCSHSQRAQSLLSKTSVYFKWSNVSDCE